MRYYSSNAGAMVLQAGVTAQETAVTVDQTVGLPGNTPFTLILDVGRPAEEVVTVTAVSGNILTVIRGEDGTSAQTHAPGAVVRHGISARDLAESRRHEDAATGVHGVTGSVVGTTDTQALSNKNLTATSNTFPATLATAANLNAHTAATAAHGATGAVVGTTNTQTLLNKTLNGPIIGTPTFLDDVNVGDVTSTTLRQFRVRRKAATGTNAYEGYSYIQSGDANGNLSLVLNENGVEVGRASLKYNGDFAVTSGNLLANNIPTSGVAGTSTAKAKKRLHWDTYISVDVNRSDATGIETGIPHGAGFTPSCVVITPSSLALQFRVFNVTATTFDLQVVNSDGSANGTSTFGFSYLCGE